MDAILTYHTNPLTCGVARFNLALSQQLALPYLNLFSPEALQTKLPLVSIKRSEFSGADALRLESIAGDPSIWPGLRLFFHDYSASPAEAKLLRRAEIVYCGNEVLFNEMRALHDNVVLAWCPGYLFDSRPFDQHAEISIYTFGMAHKLRADYFYRLRDLLDVTGKSYAIYVSAAVHEGKTLEDTFTAAYEELVECFGERVRFLGFLSDGALYNRLTSSTFFAAFFQDGVRSNNTSISTAMQSGAVVLTNLDARSPPELRHLVNVIDIRQCHDRLPLDPDVLETVRAGGQAFATSKGWEPLVDLFAAAEGDLRQGLQ
jgi:hypothetical protein